MLACCRAPQYAVSVAPLRTRPPLQRADELTEKNKAGTLSAQERAELEQMLALDRFVTALKARAAKALKQT